MREKELVLDVRGFEHHNRPPLIFRKLSEISREGKLILIVEIEPKPIIQMLREKGFATQSFQMEDGTWRIEIERR